MYWHIFVLVLHLGIIIKVWNMLHLIPVLAYFESMSHMMPSRIQQCYPKKAFACFWQLVALLSLGQVDWIVHMKAFIQESFFFPCRSFYLSSPKERCSLKESVTLVLTQYLFGWIFEWKCFLKNVAQQCMQILSKHICLCLFS